MARPVAPGADPVRLPGHFVDRRRVGSSGLAITTRPGLAKRGSVEVIPPSGAAPAEVTARNTGRRR